MPTVILLSISIQSKHQKKNENLPLDVDQIPDINHIVKRSQPPSDSYYADPDVNQMTFQVTDAALYYKNMGKLVEDIAAFDPDVIMIGWCHSQFGDVSLALRRSSQFSKMITTHELRVITGKPTAKLDEVQSAFLEDVGRL